MENKRFKIDIYKKGDGTNFCSVYYDEIEDANRFIIEEKKLNTHSYNLVDQSESIEWRNNKVELRRKEEYEKAGLTFESIAEALIEKESGNSDKLNELVTLRNSIKAQLSKE